ncbi:MAG: ABC transporter permease [Candidatus Bathyarchaeota archaeon]|nr:ABC transporter permease [Candidatus Bathyarchaeota archaeon]
MTEKTTVAPRKGVSFTMKAWKRFKRNPTVIFGASIVLIIIFTAIFAPFISPYDPKKMNYGDVYMPPNSDHLLGTDELGRDMLSRIIYGSRSSLQVGCVSVLILTVIGITVGAISGYAGGPIDNILMRITEIVMTVPSLFLLIVMVSIFKVRGLPIIMVTIGLISWPQMARVVRSEVLSIKERNYIEAANSMGASSFDILFREILPNIMAPITVMMTLRLAGAIITESSLSFLGLGDPTAITWGTMLSRGHLVIRRAWWIATFPGIAILFTTLGFNLLGDGLRDALDVRM